MSRRARETLAVYKRFTDYRDAPDDVIRFAEAKLWVERGHAVFVNRGTAIRLLRDGSPCRAGSFECNAVFVQAWRRDEAIA